MAAEQISKLFESLRESGLLESEQLKELERLPETQNPDPRALGKVLFQRGLLTKFQINLLAQGKSKDLFIGPYRLLDRLGEGGMGTVFKAHHQAMDRTVALKVIRKEKLSSPDAVKRFYAEVKAAGKLTHPNIVVAFDAGQSGNAHFLAMEFVEGIDLSRLVKEQGPLPVARACEYIRQAAVGLQHAHEKGMVHRDIKPHNLLLGKSEGGKSAVVKILDMGLARLSGFSDKEKAMTQTGAVIGTPDYLAPEQALDSHKADVRSDIYSLGCSLYFLLAGRAPFHAEALTQLLLKHQMEQAAPISKVRSDVPEKLSEVIQRMLAKNPDDRYQAPDEVVWALEPFCQGGDTSAAAVATRKGSNGGGFEESWATIVGGEEPKKSSRPVAGDKTQVGDVSKSAAKPKPGAKSKGLAPQPQGDRKLPVLLIAGIGGGVGLAALTAVIVGVFIMMSMGKPTAPTQVASNNLPTKTEVTVPTQPIVNPIDTKPNPIPNPNPNPNPIPFPPQPMNPGDPPGEGLMQFPGARGTLTNIICLNDGQRVVASTHNSIQVWDLNTRKIVETLVSDRGVTLPVKVSDDGKRVLSMGTDRNLRLFDLETRQELPRFAHHKTHVSAMALSPDGKRAATTSGQPEIKDNKPVRVDGVLVFEDLCVRVWDTATGNELQKIEPLEVSEPIRNLFLLDQGRKVLTLGRQMNMPKLVLWDAATGKKINQLGQRIAGIPAIMTVSPNEKLALFQTTDKSLILWDLQTDQQGHQLQTRGHHTVSMAISPDSRFALTGHAGLKVENGRNDVPDCPVRLWDLTTGKLVKTLEGHKDSVTAVAFTTDGKRALSGSNESFRIWDLGVEGGPVVAKIPQQPAGQRLPIPDDAKLAEADKLVKDLFQEDFAKTKPADKQALAVKLLDKAKAAKSDPPGYFVLLREARDLAAQGGDLGVSLKAIDELTRNFDVKPDEMRLTALTTVSKGVTTAAAAREVAEECLNVFDKALDDDDFATAPKLLTLAGSLAQRAQATGLNKRVQALDKELRDTEKEFEKVKPAREVLMTKANDAEANATVGKYLVLRKGDWPKGLPHLAQGNDKLASVAKKDLTNPATAADQNAVADDWWDVAKSEQGTAKAPYLQRAAHWYRQALKGLEGLTAEQVDKRLQQIAETEAGLFPPDQASPFRKLIGHAAPINSVSLSPDGKRALTGGDDRLPKVWDVTTGKELMSLEATMSPITAVMLLGDKSTKAGVGSSDGWHRFFDLETRKQLNNGGYRTPIVGLALSPDSEVMVMGTREGMVLSGNGKDASPVFRHMVVNLPSLKALGTAGNMGVLSGDNNGVVYLHDNAQRREVLQFKAHKGAVTGLSASADGQRCITIGEDKIVNVWDLSKGTSAALMRSLRGHTAPVTCVAFLPDGRRVLTGSEDKTLRLWDVATGRELMRLQGHSDKVNAVTISTDGTRALSGGADKQVLAWDLTKAP